MKQGYLLESREHMSKQIVAIEDFVKEFRARDLESIRKHLDPEFIWTDPKGEIVVQSAENFLNLMEGLLKENPKLENSSSACIQVGNIVTHSESFAGYADGHTEDWVWVYEFKVDKILKMSGFQNSL